MPHMDYYYSAKTELPPLTNEIRTDFDIDSIINRLSQKSTGFLIS
jgi:hypothetical protein